MQELKNLVQGIFARYFGCRHFSRVFLPLIIMQISHIKEMCLV